MSLTVLHTGEVDMIAQWDLFKVYQEMGERSEHIKRKKKFLINIIIDQEKWSMNI